MKFEIDFSPLLDYVFIRTEEEASIEGFRNLLEKLVNSPQWNSGMKQLYDQRESIFKEYPSEDIRHLVNTVKEYGERLGNGSCALVVRNPHGFGLARMYEFTGGSKIHRAFCIFYEIKEAVEWLKKQ